MAVAALVRHNKQSLHGASGDGHIRRYRNRGCAQAWCGVYDCQRSALKRSLSSPLCVWPQLPLSDHSCLYDPVSATDETFGRCRLNGRRLRRQQQRGTISLRTPRSTSLFGVICKCFGVCTYLSGEAPDKKKHSVSAERQRGDPAEEAARNHTDTETQEPARSGVETQVWERRELGVCGWGRKRRRKQTKRKERVEGRKREMRNARCRRAFEPLDLRVARLRAWFGLPCARSRPGAARRAKKAESRRHVASKWGKGDRLHPAKDCDHTAAVRMRTHGMTCCGSVKAERGRQSLMLMTQDEV